MLRASIEYDGSEARLSGISAGSAAGDAGIEHGGLLTTFAEAAVRGDATSLTAARDALRDAVGSAGLVDAAGVVGNFERMVRIADGTGIPLDSFVEVMSKDFRKDLGLEQFQSRRTTTPGFFTRTFGPAFNLVVQSGLRIAGRRARRRRMTGRN
jgi:hypothetical protein